MVKPIPLHVYASFISNHFISNGYGISTEAIEYLYQKFEGATWYIQKICNEMFAYADSGTTCSICDVDQAINTAIEEKDDTFQDLLTRLTINQKSLLIAMAHADKDFQPTSVSFIKKYNLSSPSSVQRSLNALQEKDLITSVNGRYSIYDYFLELWLKNKF